jgi:hypothetical protein
MFQILYLLPKTKGEWAALLIRIQDLPYSHLGLEIG